jgi:cytochrome P450 family 6
LAKQPDIQEHLRNEIREALVRHNGIVTFEMVSNINEMPYAHQVLNETLRMYSVMPFLDRECTKADGYSLEPFSDFKIPHGMPVLIPFFSLGRDEKYFPEPLKYDPDRFSPENIHNVPSCAHTPFGTGPRVCIGERLALIQVKTALVKLLQDFRVETTDKTPMTIEFTKKAMLIQSNKGLFVNFVKDPLQID